MTDPQDPNRHPVSARSTPHEIAESERLEQARSDASKANATAGPVGLHSAGIPPAARDFGYAKSEFLDIAGYFRGRLWALLKRPIRIARR